MVRRSSRGRYRAPRRARNARSAAMSTFTAEIRSGRVAANALIRAPSAAASAAGGPATPPRITTPRYCDPAARARSAWAPRTAGESGGNSSSSSGRSCS